MALKEVEQFSVRSTVQSRYDKRLILKIVKQVEEGLPRKEAVNMYGLGKNSLSSWMRKYGSDNYHQKLKRKSYSSLQKRTIVNAIEQGRMSISEAQVAYAIKNRKTIREWLLQFKEEKVEICIDNTLGVGKKKKAISKEKTAELQKSLQEAELKIKALNTLIDVAEEQLKISIRKKSGARQS